MLNLIYSLLPVACFVAGFCFGFKVKKNDELPKIKSPVEVFEEHKDKVEDRKKARQESKELEIYLENIENYPYDQKEIK